MVRRAAGVRAGRPVDWIIVQMHQDAASSSASGNGSDLGIREEWLPLFDAADAVEDATWSAVRDPSTGYGVAVFDVDPGERGGETSITVTYYHAVGADRPTPAPARPAPRTPSTRPLKRSRSSGPARTAPLGRPRSQPARPPAAAGWPHWVRL